MGIFVGAYQTLRSVVHRAGQFASKKLAKFRKLWWLHVLLAIILWTVCLLTLDNHGPWFIRSPSMSLAEYVTFWQATLTILLLFYVFRSSRNALNNLGVESPDLANKLYSPSFFQATELATAFDAGFWTAMVFKEGWVRDVFSLVFTVYYALAPDQADKKARRIRSVATIDRLRVSWNKATTPYLRAIGKLLRPEFTNHGPREIHIQRPKDSSYKEPVKAWLYFDGTDVELKKQTCLVLDIPGGGFVAMNPRTADDRLLAWAGKTKLPILSLDYGKAPEYLYPYALNECYDVYRSIVDTRGGCLGLAGDVLPYIVVSGDSAGGNLAASMTLKIISAGTLPVPDGLVMAYPCLSMKVEAWMTPEQVSLVGNNRSNTTPSSSDQTLLGHDSDSTKNPSEQDVEFSPEVCVSSMISFMDDRVLTPDTMRSLILFYVGSGNHVDFATDYFLSPVLAPTDLLAKFPKTYIVTGERDPMVDDTVIFAERLRNAKFQQFKRAPPTTAATWFNDLDHVDISLIRGVSHGFMQMAGFYPEAWTYIFQAAGWVSELMAAAQVERGGVPQHPLFAQLGNSPDHVDEEELLGRRMKFLAGRLLG